MLVTGMVVGAGSGPMHSLIEISQSGKETLDKFKEDAQSKDLKKEIEDLKKKIEEISSGDRGEH